MAEGLVEDLRQAVAAGRIVVVAGAGVSMAASGGAPAASWGGLLEEAVRYCEANVPGVPAKWATAVRSFLELGEVDSLLSAADQVTVKLGGRKGGEYGRFLRESVGELPLVDDRVSKALVGLGVPVMTTNYDSLIEQATEWDSVTWRNMGRFRQVLVDRAPVVAHLHGRWDGPESVVLGLRSYDELLGEAGVQGLQQAVVALKSLLFVGVGEGASDPNWGPLRAWAKEAFGFSQDRHFRLCRTGEVERLVREHEGERIVPVAYGDEHGDLDGFLESLAPPGRPPAVEAGAAATPAALPAKPLTVGRDEEVARLVSVVLDNDAGPALALGPPGVGKTNLTVAALHDPVVATRFGERRYFVRCDGAADASALVIELAAALGVPAMGTDPLPAVRATLAASPVLLVLDNAETPWEPDTLAVEEVLSTLAGIPGVGLVVSVRGSERPGGVPWAPPLRLQPLPLDKARDLFLKIAGDRFDTDGLDGLLEDMGGLPLAILLLAHAAEAEPSIESLAGLWREQRSRLLARAGGQDKSLSVAASAEVSWASPLLTEAAKRLLSLLSVLSDGIAHEDLDALIPRSGREAAHRLRQRALAFDVAGRLRTHPPLGHHIAEAHPPDVEDHDRAHRHYIDLVAQRGDTVGRAGGAEAASRLIAEAANITVAFTAVLERPEPTPALDAIGDLAEFARFTGVDVTEMLNRAITVADTHGDIGGQAKTRSSGGLVALDRSDHDSARARFEEARPLYGQVGDVLGEANCIQSLGDIALRRSDHDAARARFEEARPLYGQVGDVLGEANCIKGLGDIALERSDHDAARARFEEARPLFREVGSVLGEAHCIQRLGDIALRRSDHDAARARFEEARPLYGQVGDVLGEANCIQRLGDIALRRSDHDSARGRYDEALPLFREVGSVLGEANCIQRLGDIALRRSDHDSARGRYDEALLLYERIPEPYSIGRTHRRLARLDGSDTDRIRHVAAAREAWMKIKRSDLVAELDDEFG